MFLLGKLANKLLIYYDILIYIEIYQSLPLKNFYFKIVVSAATGLISEELLPQKCLETFFLFTSVSSLLQIS